MNKRKLFIFVLYLITASTLTTLWSLGSSDSQNDESEVQLLHVSFDIAREIGRRLNEGFIPWYKEQTGVSVAIEQSNAGSSRQARAVSEGLPADVVSMNQYLDIDLIYNETATKPEGALIPRDWQSLYPNQSSPASSTMAFVVRKGNPKQIRDWDDLIRDDVAVIAPNYRSTGNGRYSLLTAYSYGLNKYGSSPEDAYRFVSALIDNTGILATGGRDATNIFVERGQGDVLLTFEAEVNLIVQDLGPDSFEVVVPSYGVDAKIYVVVVEKNAKEKGEAQYQAAKAYWDFIYTDQGQEIVAQSFFRPIQKDIAARYQNALPNIELFTVEDVYGDWGRVRDLLFDDDGVVESIYQELGKQ